MLLVKTYLDKSPINGIGLFAAEAIPAGTVIWQLDGYYDVVLHQVDMEGNPDIIQEFLDKYTYKDNKVYVLCVDDARFMNHSDSPNTENGRGSLHETVASRDIAVGEEITCDYFDIDDDANKKINK